MEYGGGVGVGVGGWEGRGRGSDLRACTKRAARQPQHDQCGGYGELAHTPHRGQEWGASPHPKPAQATGNPTG